MAALARRTIAHPARMGLSLDAGNAYLCVGLWLPVLGGAARAIRHRRSYSSDHSRLHCVNGNPDSADTETNGTIRLGLLERIGCRTFSENYFFSWRRTSFQPSRRSRTFVCLIHVVDRI